MRRWLAILDLERESGQPLDDGAVELPLVHLRGLLVERRSEVVAQVGQELRACLDEIDVGAVPLLGLVARRRVVSALGLLAFTDQILLLADEEFELARDDFGEAAAPEHAPRLAPRLELLIRTWNLFHGNAQPAERRDYLAEMVRLVSADRPDVVCLQELPVWALTHLEAWSGMRAFGDVAQHPRFGPVPIPAELGREITSLHHGVLRSAFTGQANAILLKGDAALLDRGVLVLNSREFRDRQARWLRLGLVARLAWAKERRVVQTVRAELPDGTIVLVANLHTTSYPADQRLADAELLRAAVYVDGLAEPGDVVVLAGDFNVPAARSVTQPELTSPEWGFSEPLGEGIDQILVRSATVAELTRWPRERRRFDGRVLSDHTPVEARAA
jgi:endonuclease/exonuclease/phosphatase family metal-dependent hydrolase